MKVSIELSRKATISCGKFNAIRPSVTMRLDELSSDQVAEKTEVLAELLDALFAKEVIALSGEINTIGDVGFQHYTTALEGQELLINENIDKLYKKLIGNGE